MDVSLENRSFKQRPEFGGGSGTVVVVLVTVDGDGLTGALHIL